MACFSTRSSKFSYLVVAVAISLFLITVVLLSLPLHWSDLHSPRLVDNYLAKGPTAAADVGSFSVTAWRVSRPEGVRVSLSREGLSSGPYVHWLEKGAILLSASAAEKESLPEISTRFSCDRFDLDISLVYPIRGWISSGSCIRFNEFENVIELLEDRDLSFAEAEKAVTDSRCEGVQWSRLGVDLAGGDVSEVPNHVSSAKDCCRLCTVVEGCGGWTLVDQHDCWIKRAGKFSEHPVTRENIQSGIFPPGKAGLSAMSHVSVETDESSIPRCCLPDSRKGRSGEGEAETVIRIDNPRLDWTSQFPVGTGAFGGMVGGVSEAELVPLSIAGLFVTREAKISQENDAFEKDGVPMEKLREAYLSNDKKEMQSELRRAILSGQTATKIISEQHQHSSENSEPRVVNSVPLGSFQYLYDLTLLFDIPLSDDTEVVGPSNEHLDEVVLKTKDGLKGRNGVLSRLYSFLWSKKWMSSLSDAVGLWSSELNSAENLRANSDGNDASRIKNVRMFQDIADVSLDTRTGIVKSYYLTGYTVPGSNGCGPPTGASMCSTASFYYLAQERTWFASHHYNVIVGNFKGKYFRRHTIGEFRTGVVHGAMDVVLSVTRDIMDEAVQDGFIYSSEVFEWSHGVKSGRNPNLSSLLKFVMSLSSLERTDVILAAIRSRYCATTPCKGGEGCWPERGRKCNRVDDELKDEQLDKIYLDNSVVYGIETWFGMGADPSVTVPNSLLCAAVVCLSPSSAVSPMRNQWAGGDRRMSKNSKGEMPLDSNTIWCRSVDEVQIILASEISESTYTAQNAFAQDNDLESLRSNCWKKIVVALELGYGELQSKHRAFHRARNEDFAKVSFVPREGASGWNTCPAQPAGDRLATFGSGCIEAPTDAGNESILKKHFDNLDTNLLAQMYNFGSYLIFSSATRAVSNLQGIWADGPTSAWSGDYHMNINLQMNYWSMHSSGMYSYLFPPVQQYIQKLTVTGSEASSRLYNLTGWVAHGFTDSTLRAHLHGDPQWSLCVTCGAWIALHLWDAVTFESLRRFNATKELNFLSLSDIVMLLDGINMTSGLIDLAVPVFRGAAEFFCNYLYISDDGTPHTGPTTSPENSYMFGESDIEFLTMSPAIDISILRQLSNSFMIILQLQLADLDSCGALLNQLEKQFDEQAYRHLGIRNSDIDRAKISLVQRTARWNNDAVLALKFMRLVQRMVGGAVPMLEQIDSSAVEARAGGYLISEYPGLLPGGAKNMKAVRLEHADLLGVSNFSKMMPSTALFSSDRMQYVAAHIANISSTAPLQIDPGHRHWSSLHWLYPGSLIPFAPSRGGKNIRLREVLFRASKDTLLYKSNAGGGHTGWSAAWGAALFARLGDGENSFKFLRRILQRYTASNLMGLHPALASRRIAGCETCFFDAQIDYQVSSYEFPDTEMGDSDPYARFNEPRKKKSNYGSVKKSNSVLGQKNFFTIEENQEHGNLDQASSRRISELVSLQRRRSGKEPQRHEPNPPNTWSYNPFLFSNGRRPSSLRGSTPGTSARISGSTFRGALRPDRGMMTEDDAKFQFDANAGFVAAVNEMLVQSHVPAFYSILPALPLTLMKAGFVKNMRCRGAVNVSFEWHMGNVVNLTIQFKEPHPWISKMLSRNQNLESGFVLLADDVSASDEICMESMRLQSTYVRRYFMPLQAPTEKGFFNNEGNNDDIVITLDLPNKMELTRGDCSGAVPPDETDCARAVRRLRTAGRRFAVEIKISRFPCTVKFVNSTRRHN